MDGTTFPLNDVPPGAKLRAMGPSLTFCLCRCKKGRKVFNGGGNRQGKGDEPLL